MRRSAADTLDEMEVPQTQNINAPGLDLVEDLVEDTSIAPPMNWVTVIAALASANRDKYQTNPRDRWYFQFPDDEEKKKAYRVKELGNVGLRFGVSMRPPWHDRESGRYVTQFNIYLYPQTLNDQGDLLDFRDVNQKPMNSRTEHAMIDTLDDAGVKRRITIPRHEVRPLLTESMTNLLLNRCAHMMVREFKRICETAGVDFRLAGMPLPCPSEDPQKAVADHGCFQFYTM